MVLLVLLIACANVANLLLAVAVARRQEAAIKLALGAPRGRLIREFLAESMLLCVASGLLGFGVAAWVIRRFSDFRATFPMFGEFSFGLHLPLNATVVAFTLVLTMVAILATGLAPALYASSPGLAQVLGGEMTVGGTRKAARRNVPVIVEVAIATLVLVGMGLCQRNLHKLRHADISCVTPTWAFPRAIWWPPRYISTRRATRESVESSSTRLSGEPPQLCRAWNRSRWPGTCRCLGIASARTTSGWRQAGIGVPHRGGQRLLSNFRHPHTIRPRLRFARPRERPGRHRDQSKDRGPVLSCFSSIKHRNRIALSVVQTIVHFRSKSACRVVTHLNKYEPRSMMSGPGIQAPQRSLKIWFSRRRKGGRHEIFQAAQPT
jgi:hypothetical protein